MMVAPKTIREASFGKVTVRLMQVGSTFKVATIAGSKITFVFDGSYSDQLWQHAISQVGKSAPGFWGYADARQRFLGNFRSLLLIQHTKRANGLTKTWREIS